MISRLVAYIANQLNIGVYTDTDFTTNPSHYIKLAWASVLPTRVVISTEEAAIHPELSTQPGVVIVSDPSTVRYSLNGTLYKYVNHRLIKDTTSVVPSSFNDNITALLSTVVNIGATGGTGGGTIDGIIDCGDANG
jgi:hypothetical protein